MTKKEKVVFVFLSSLIWIYLGLRAFYVPLIHDEALTYYLYIQDANFIPPWSHWDANNHILYSAISSLFTHWFGSFNWVIRLATWLSFIPFIWGIFKFTNQIPSIFKRWMLIFPLLFSTYLIEFFALARGYGLGMGLLICCLWSAFQYTKSPSQKWLVAIVIIGFLGALANLSMLVSVLLIYAWIGIYQVVYLGKGKWKSTLLWMGLSILTLLPLVYYGFLLREKGLLYYGNHNYQLSLDLLAQMLLGKRSLGWVWLVALIGICLFYIWNPIKNSWKHLLQPENIFSFVLIFSVVAIILQYFFLGIKFPTDRSILHLFVLLVFSLVFLPVSNANKFWTLSLGVLLFFPIDFLRSMNLTHSKFWDYEHVPVAFSQTVRKGSVNEYPPTVNGYQLRSLIWSATQKNADYFPSSIVYDKHPDEWADFVLVDSSNIKKLNTHRFDTVQYDIISGQYLLKQKVSNTEIFLWDTVMYNLSVEDLRTNFLDFELADSVRFPIAIYLNFEIESENPKINSEIAFEAFHEDGTSQTLNVYKLGHYSEFWNQKRVWKVKSYFPIQTNSTQGVRARFNIAKKDAIFIPKLECKLFKITRGFE